MSKSKSRPVLHVIATSHLDTQWRWTYEDVIAQFLTATVRENAPLFDKYPGYVFSFESAWRYMLLKEYHPAEFAAVRGYVARGCWTLCGSAVEAGDVNTVSPESLVRQFLLGNGFFARELGVRSRDVFLPDCFGFGWALPSIAAHCGLVSFSTSKLEWGSSIGIPFDIGFWEGVNGDGLVACINPGQYSFPIKEEDLANDSGWNERLAKFEAATGIAQGFKYFGLGDVGGAPDEASVAKLQAAIDDATSTLDVRSSAPDALALSLSPEQRERLPRHRGEFLLIEHGTGTYTSNGWMKQWNRQNELLADSAERLATAASNFAGSVYPQEWLRDAWVRVLASQMHDILPGTCIPEAYRLSWHDEALAWNAFASVEDEALATFARLLDTTAPEGHIPVMLWNPLSCERADDVAFEIDAARLAGSDAWEAVWDSSDAAAPTQIDRDGAKARVLLRTRLAPMETRVVHLRPCPTLPHATTPDAVLENDNLRVKFDKATGAIVSIFDKRHRREVLAAPVHLQVLETAPAEWPAWTIVHRDVSAPPRGMPRLLSMTRGASGLLCQSLLLEMEYRDPEHADREPFGPSRFWLEVALAADRLEFHLRVDWRSKGALLKFVVPSEIKPEKVVYDLGLGVIERGTNTEKLHEVPAQQWAELSDGTLGLAVLSSSKYGWDYPEPGVLRHTLLHTPLLTGFHCHIGGANYVDWFTDQATLDFGRQEMRVALWMHDGDWKAGQVRAAAQRFNQPARAVVIEQPAPGPMGRSLRLLDKLTDGVDLVALKHAEDSDEIIVRLQETRGVAHERVELRLWSPIVAAREVNGAEEPLGPATIVDGCLTTDLKRFGLRTFALRLQGVVAPALPKCQAIELPFNQRGISRDANRQDGDFDGAGHSIPAELLPETLFVGDVTFVTGPRGHREPNILACRGQHLALPEQHGGGTIALLCAGTCNLHAEIGVDDSLMPVHVPAWDRLLGQQPTMIRDGVYVEAPLEQRPPASDRLPIAWIGSHRHHRATGADEVYRTCLLYLVEIPVTAGARTMQLPDEPALKIVAASLVARPPRAVRVQGRWTPQTPAF